MDRVNLFVVGVNKAGTSWLYYLLDSHPNVFMCAEKELFYFGERYPEGMEAYHARFPFEQPYRYFGEATAAYSRNPATAAEIYDYAPEAKVLAIVRDPIARLHSQFYYHKQLGNVSEEASAADLAGSALARFREHSRYEKMLPPFAEAFGPQQFRVLSLEEGAADLPAFWEDVQAFLDLRPVPVPEARQRASNATGGSRFRTLYRHTVRPIKRHAPALYRALLRSTWASVAKRGLLSLLGRAEKEPIPASVRCRLAEDLQPTYRYLAELGFDCYDQP